LAIFETRSVIEGVTKGSFVADLFVVNSEVLANPLAAIREGQRTLHVEGTLHLLVFAHTLYRLRRSVYHVILR